MTLIAAWQRARAVERLEPDFDEIPYLIAAYRDAERMEPGRWGEILDVTENQEHPPLVKLAYGVAVKTRRRVRRRRLNDRYSGVPRRDEPSPPAACAASAVRVQPPAAPPRSSQTAAPPARAAIARRL
jgi:hypothetical protein